MATEPDTSTAQNDAYDQPVAYDQDGRPLYAHPSRPADTRPAVMHVARPVSPEMEPVPPRVKQRHDESVRRFPNLNLSAGEYVIIALRRHPIGLFQIWAIALALVAALSVVFGLLMNAEGTGDLGSLLGGSATSGISAIVALFLAMVIMGALVASYTYDRNRFYLTNESVIQEIRPTLFSRNEQTISLGNIEDASYHQSGIVQSMLNYGLIRLSTEGEETTYSFELAPNPRHNIAILNNAVEAFKNGRPVDPDEY